ncbi:hypothetical protein PR048_004536 [Dryococelus australis]|uniref:Zinc finger MYM-type protein 1 n=1 Tax=Dryococelus australis TaxID=614101 RepID=A0ABQ9I5Q3_9NEOP|nr:hypothetical protein PR048_004536 [Dryococelus australis]
MIAKMRKYYFQPRWYEKFSWLHFDNAEKGFLCSICSKACKINILKHLALQGLAIRWHSNEQEQQGNFMQLLPLKLEDVHEFCNWMQRRKNLCSGDVQNKILCKSWHTNVLRSIASNKHACGEFSLIVDETADVAGVEQVSINIRIVKDLKPEELFLGLYSTSSTTGESLFKLIMNVLSLNIQLQNMRGQCYDGTANMFDTFKGVQARIAHEQPLALSVHCGNHSLNLAQQDWTNDVAVIICNSLKRKAQFAEICLVNEENVSSGVHPLCPTRWTARVASISGILNTYNSVLAMLSNIAESKEERSRRADVLKPHELLSHVLQDPNGTVAGGRELEEPKLLTNGRNPKRYDYDESTSAHQFGSAKDMLQVLFFETIDLLVGEIEKRFNQPGYEKYQIMESCLLLSLNMLPKLVPSVNSENDIVVAFKALHPETRYLFAELDKILKLLLVVPISSVTAEQSFSILRIIKTFLRSTMSQSRLTHLCILNVHKEQPQALKINNLMKEFVNNDYHHTVFGAISCDQ